MNRESSYPESTVPNGPEDKQFLELQEMIRDLPDIDPPAVLAPSIMQQLTPRKRPFLRRISDFIRSRRTITFVPGQIVAAAACLLLFFSLGVWTGSENKESVPTLQKHVAPLMTDSRSGPALHYQMGRNLLVAGKPEQALPYFKQAAASSPDNPEYLFWKGVSHSALDEFDLERESYMKAISHAPDHSLASLYLGHNLMESGNYSEALRQYDRVLEIDPESLEASYNRGLVFAKMDKVREETLAWKSFLAGHQSGKWAIRAVDHLNSLGDFSFRTYQIGLRRIVARQTTFTPEGMVTPESIESLLRIGRASEHNTAMTLHLVTYVKNDIGEAKKRANNLKRVMTKHFPGASHRLKISWFNETEKIQIHDDLHSLDESVMIFGERNKKISI